MTERDKKLLEVFTLYLNKIGCKFARFEVDQYNYNIFGNRFICMENEDYGNSMKSIVKMDDTIKNICEENNDEIFDDDGDGGSLSEIYVDIYPETRTIKILGSFSVLKSIDDHTETNTKELPQEIIDQFTTSGITHAYIDFNGGGDSGYIEEEFKDQNGNDQRLSQFGNLEDILLAFLDNYGDWYNNEGAQGSFTIDVPEKEMSYEVTPNDYVYENYEFTQLNY